MAKNRTSYVEGADKLDAALKRIGDRATGLLLKEATQKGANIIAAEARRLAPRKSGKLAEGIHAEITTSQAGRAVADVSFNRKQWYGRLIEKGSKNMAAKPYLRPALDTKADEAEQAVADFLWDAIQDVL